LGPVSTGTAIESKEGNSPSDDQFRPRQPVALKVLRTGKDSVLEGVGTTTITEATLITENE